MKIAFFTHQAGVLGKRLDEPSIQKLMQGVDYAFDRMLKQKSNLTMVVFFEGSMYLHNHDAERVKLGIKGQGGVVLAAMADLLVIQTEESRILTIRFIGGASTFFYETVDNTELGGTPVGSLTQECRNVFN